MPSSATLQAAASTIVGVDEAGRGALAGPVVAGACVLIPKKRYPVTIGDSKQMTPEEREHSYLWITGHCMYGVGIVPAHVIDEIGILAANEIAMQQAVKEISRQCSDLYLLIDGRDKFWFDHPHSSIVRGDSKEKCIGAASIIAKVTRDRLMAGEIHAAHPEYGFAEHKGYGTPEHFGTLQKYGPCTFHRKTFLRNFFDSSAS